MHALGDDQMVEAKDRQQKERSNKVVRTKGGERRDSQALKEGGSVLHGQTSQRD